MRVSSDIPLVSLEPGLIAVTLRGEKLPTAVSSPLKNSVGNSGDLGLGRAHQRDPSPHYGVTQK